MRIRRVASVAIVAGLALAACGSDDDDSTSEAPEGTEAAGETEGTEAAGGEGGDCVVGVSWNNFQEPRWANFDEPAMKAAIEAGGGTYVSNDAKSSAETQASNVENLISQGANVVVILAQDGTAIIPSVQAATTAGIPVIAYDRLIEDPEVLYLTFDNQLVGEMQAQALFDIQPTGNWVIIKGNSADANADFLRGGAEKVIGEAVAAGDITIVGEDYTDNWDPANAQATMEGYLTAQDNNIDVALVQNDGMAGGVIAALDAQGLAGQVPVSGQDGDLPALNRVALGTQAVDVWKDARELGKAAGESAIALCANPDPSAVAGAAPFTTPGETEVSAIFLEPIPITQDNLDLVVDAGWITTEELCAGVESGSVAACP
jgi:D-xylose transport system substrate-binding protein